jgi:hypothetical protein
MKTFSLTESAYLRFPSWKEGRAFLQVIEGILPPKGAIEAVGNYPDISAKDFDELEKAVNAVRQRLPAAWSDRGHKGVDRDVAFPPDPSAARGHARLPGNFS